MDCTDCDDLYTSLRNSLSLEGLLRAVDRIVMHLQATAFHTKEPK